MRTIDFNHLDKNKVFFTSDTHFGHENIIKICNRPFKDVAEMNYRLILAWNSVVAPDDIVFHLGDFAHGDIEYWDNILSQLNGRIILITGNHDLKVLNSGTPKRFELVTPQMTINVDGQRIILNHYPMLCYAGAERGVWQLFGHIHTSPYNTSNPDFKRIPYLYPTQYDVGVENNEFRPVSYEEVKRIIAHKTSK